MLRINFQSKIFMNTLNTYWSSLVIEELVRNGINHFVISPGARSTPLVSATALHKKTKCYVAYDERGAGFYALGYAKAMGKPAVLISTSGTAPANYFPAVIEAYQENIPMIILSADRPIELQDCGANQTINQSNLFGNYTQWTFNFPCPDIVIPPEFVLTTMNQACAKSEIGPVHLNFMFREPLTPIMEKIPAQYRQNIKKWESQKTPFTTYHSPNICISKENIDYISKKLKNSKKCLISVGTLYSKKDQEDVLKLIKKLDCPVYADITSGLRLTECGTNIIKHFDQELLSEKFNHFIAPDLLLHIGGKITSKRFSQFFNLNRPQYYFVINHHNNRLDDIHIVTHQFQSNISSFCKKLKSKVTKFNNEYLTTFQNLAKKTQVIIENNCNKQNNFNEVFISREISKNINEKQALFLSNSMPIRDMELYSVEKKSLVQTGSNRGVSGIDGIISTSAGYAKGINKTTTLLIGDIAFIHDINALSSLSKTQIPLIIVLINNKGGGIFNFLPISEHKDICKEFFITPHNYDFCGACKTFQIPYHKANSKQEFTEIYKESIKKEKLTVIECVTEQQIDYDLRKKIKYEIIEMLNLTSV